MSEINFRENCCFGYQVPILKTGGAETTLWDSPGLHFWDNCVVLYQKGTVINWKLDKDISISIFGGIYWQVPPMNKTLNVLRNVNRPPTWKNQLMPINNGTHRLWSK